MVWVDNTGNTFGDIGIIYFINLDNVFFRCLLHVTCYKAKFWQTGAQYLFHKALQKYPLTSGIPLKPLSSDGMWVPNSYNK